MDNTSFSVTYDYRCPFARNAHEHLVVALGSGAPLDVRFTPFVLGAGDLAEGPLAIWTDDAKRPTLTALVASVVVRDRFPGDFLAVHEALFQVRHDAGADLRDEVVVRTSLATAGVDPAAVFREIENGWPYEILRTEHEQAVIDHAVFGVPTFIANGEAAFVRVMTRPQGNAKLALTTLETVLNLLQDHVEINEFKHTTIPN